MKVRATANGLAYNLAILTFAAPAPIVNNALIEALLHASTPKWLATSLGLSAWVYVSIILAAIALAESHRQGCMPQRVGMKRPELGNQCQRHQGEEGKILQPHTPGLYCSVGCAPILSALGAVALMLAIDAGLGAALGNARNIDPAALSHSDTH
jgi:hypothetical protein